MVAMTESVLESPEGIVFFALCNSLLVFQYNSITVVATKRLTYG